MADKNQKYKTLDIAVDITKKYAKGGCDKWTPAMVLKETYDTILKIYEDIDQTDEQPGRLTTVAAEGRRIWGIRAEEAGLGRRTRVLYRDIRADIRYPT